MDEKNRSEFSNKLNICKIEIKKARNFLDQMLPISNANYAKLKEQLSEFKNAVTYLARTTDGSINICKNNISILKVQNIHSSIIDVLNEVYSQLVAASQEISEILETLKKVIQQSKDIIIDDNDEKFKENIETLKNINIEKKTTITRLDYCYKNVKIVQSTINIIPLNSIIHKIGKVYVLMFVNTDFGCYLCPLKLKDDKEWANKVFSNVNKYFFDCKENTDLTNTYNIIKTLGQTFSTESVKDCDALLLIFDSHGADRGRIYANSDLCFTIADVWSWCSENKNLINKPVVTIVSACRGSETDHRSMPSTLPIYEPPPTLTPIIYPYHLNHLAVFAAADEKKAYVRADNTGSYFLQDLFKVFQEKPEWDILAQITWVTQEVLDKCRLCDENKTHDVHLTQTVNYTSLLPGQCKLTADINALKDDHDDGWSQCEEYEQGLVYVLVVNFDEEKLKTIKSAFGDANITIQSQSKLTTAITRTAHEIDANPDIKSLILIINMDMSNNHEERKLFQNYLEAAFSFYSQPKLINCPKIALVLKDSNCTYKPMTDETEKAIMKENILTSKELRTTKTRNTSQATINSKVSEKSDILIYNNSVSDCFEATLEVIRNLADHEPGLVRLITTQAMSKSESQLSINPADFYSSLRKKYVLRVKTAANIKTQCIANSRHDFYNIFIILCIIFIPILFPLIFNYP